MANPCDERKFWWKKTTTFSWTEIRCRLNMDYKLLGVNKNQETHGSMNFICSSIRGSGLRSSFTRAIKSGNRFWFLVTALSHFHTTTNVYCVCTHFHLIDWLKKTWMWGQFHLPFMFHAPPPHTNIHVHAICKRKLFLFVYQIACYNVSYKSIC